MIEQKNKNNRRNSEYDSFINSDGYSEIELGISDAPGSAKKQRTEPARSSVAPKSKKKSNKEDKNANYYLLLSASICVVIIFLCSFLTLVIKDKEYSENEKRYLAQKPLFSFSALADGSFTKDVESYLSDQFAGRSLLVRTRTAIDIFAGKKEINGIYIGKKHRLFEKPNKYDEKEISETVKSINELKNNNQKIRTFFTLVPDSSYILKDYLPNNVILPDQSKQIKTIYSKLNKSIKTIDVCTPLKNAGEPERLYYKTDHHWTTSAAQIALEPIAKQMGVNISKTAFKTFAVSNKFKGTLAASSGLFNANDLIEITYPESKQEYYVEYVDEEKKSASVFDYNKLNTKNQYEVFFGGNFAQIDIETTVKSDKVLMVIKDSYANCFVPMLTDYYSEIVMLDPRYFQGSIEDVIKKEGVTDILWLYNLNTFLADSSIRTLSE